MKQYIHSDGISWPVPDGEMDSLAHALRYGTADEALAMRHVAAHVVAAYQDLVLGSALRRRIIAGELKKLAKGGQ